MGIARHGIVALLLVLGTAAWGQSPGKADSSLKSRNFGRGAIDTSLYLLQKFEPPKPGLVQHPVFNSLYTGEDDRVLAETKYGPVRERDFYLWLILSESKSAPYLVDLYRKAATATEKEQLGKELRQRIEEYVFANMAVPRMIPDAPCDPTGNLKAYVYSLKGYQLAYILDCVLPQVRIATADQVMYLNENKGRIAEPERWRVRYIFKKSSLDDPLEQQDATEQTLRDLRDKVMAGETSFADAARQASEAPSAARGGEIPPFRRGELAFGFEEAASSLQPGEVSDIFRGPNGLYMVQLLETLPAEEPTLENPKQLEKVNEGVMRKILRAHYEWDTKKLFKARRPIAHVELWDEKKCDDLVGEVCDFRLTKCQFWMAFPGLEDERLTLRQDDLKNTMQAILEREAMAQEVRAQARDNSPVILKARDIACNLARRDAFVEAKYNALKVGDDRLKRFWSANPRLFTPLAMKRIVRVMLTPANIAPTPEQTKAELETYLFGAPVETEAKAPAARPTDDRPTTPPLGGAGAPAPVAGGTAPPPWAHDYTRSAEPGQNSRAGGPPILPLGRYQRLAPTAMRAKVAAYKSSEWVMRFDDYGFVFIEDRTDIPASADRLPVGSFTPVAMEKNAAVTWYIEDARRQDKPAFDEIKAQVYATYRQVEVQKQMRRLFDDVTGKAGIRYRF